MCPRALLLVVRDSRLRDRKERETLNQKGASFFANWPLATQQRPVINPTEHERKKKKSIVGYISFYASEVEEMSNSTIASSSIYFLSKKLLSNNN